MHKKNLGSSFITNFVLAMAIFVTIVLAHFRVAYFVCSTNVFAICQVELTHVNELDVVCDG